MERRLTVETTHAGTFAMTDMIGFKLSSMNTTAVKFAKNLRKKLKFSDRHA